MYPEIKILLNQAEQQYLQPQDIETFKHHVLSISTRLEAYELLRDNEVALIQPIADRLLSIFPQEKQENLERALKHWLSVMRYCAIAMLLNNPEFLQRSLLEWLTDIVQVHQTQAIEMAIYELLQVHLPEYLNSEHMALVQPFLTQAEETLLGTGKLAQLPR
jgi:hypothetical protein